MGLRGGNMGYGTYLAAPHEPAPHEPSTTITTEEP
jgi:hypothetical protein